MTTILSFKQKTAYEMRISDWSSDVCSSDLFLKPRERRRDITASRREASAHQIPRCKLIDKAPLADGGEITLRQISRHRQFDALVQQFGKRQCRQGGQAGTLPLNRLSQCQRLFKKLPGKSRFSLRHQGRRDRSLKRDGGEIRTRTVKHPARDRKSTRLNSSH